MTAITSPLPHAGALAYDDGVPKIPAAAVSTEDADVLAELARRGPVEIELSLGARTLPDVRAPTSSASCTGESARTRSCCSARISTRGTWARARPTTARDVSP